MFVNVLVPLKRNKYAGEYIHKHMQINSQLIPFFEVHKILFNNL